MPEFMKRMQMVEIMEKQAPRSTESLANQKIMV